jgi:hypothetical protein
MRPGAAPPHLCERAADTEEPTRHKRENRRGKVMDGGGGPGCLAPTLGSSATDFFGQQAHFGRQSCTPTPELRALSGPGFVSLFAGPYSCSN